jgi:hypothetical protein
VAGQNLFSKIPGEAMRPLAANLEGSARVVGAGRLAETARLRDCASADCLFIIAALEAPAVVAGLDDVQDGSEPSADRGNSKQH